jgi:hypothetical protein
MPRVLIPTSSGARSGGDRTRFGVFGATVAFFLAEMGDKTQIAMVALAARFDNLAAVVIGTTLGMLLANVPAVLSAGRGEDSHARRARGRSAGPLPSEWPCSPGSGALRSLN